MAGKKIKKTSLIASLTGLRFIFLLLAILLVMDLFVIGIHGWLSIEVLTAEGKINNEQLLASKLDQINILFNADKQLLASSSAEKVIPQNIFQTFDSGVVINHGGKITSAYYSQIASHAFPQFLKQFSAKTSEVSVDENAKILYITQFNTNNDYAIGAINLNGPIFHALLKTLNHTYFLLSDGVILTSDAKNNDAEFIRSLNLQPNEINTVTIGNMQKQFFMYNPIANTPLGFGILSESIYSLLFSDTIQFAVFTSLGFLAMFLTISFVFSILMELPLLRLINYLELVQTGNLEEIPVGRDGSFNLLYKQINGFVQTLRLDKIRSRQSDKLQKDFILLSGHILRTPLASMAGYLDLLKQINEEPKLGKYITNIETALQKLLQVEENLIALSEEDSKLLSLNRQKVLVSDIVQTAFNELAGRAASKQIQYKLIASDLTDEVVYADKELLVHALTNLLDNAIKFTPENGTVKLYTKKILRNIIICISDTGIGIDPEEKEQLFKKFSRVSSSMEYNTDGLGIGLFIASQIVAGYEGEIWVDSIKGSGSIFNMKLVLSA